MADKPQFFNNVQLLVREFLEASDTTITVDNLQGLYLDTDSYIIGSLIPSGGQGSWEIVHITGISGNDLTVVRGQEGTTPQSFLFGAILAINITAGGLKAIQDASNNLLDRLAVKTGAESGASLIGYRGRTVLNRLDDVINVLDYGAVGDGITNDTIAFNTALNEARATKKGLIIPETSASYLLNTGEINFAGNFLTITGIGMPTLQYTGGGEAFITKADVGEIVYGMSIENLRIVGSGTNTIGWAFQGLVHGQFINIEIKNAGSSRGIRLAGSVLNTFNNIRVNSQGSTVHPFIYWYLDMSDPLNPDTRCQSNIFIDCLAEGQGAASTSIGFYLNYAVLNRFYGCVSESLDVGIELATDTCRLNSFHGIDLEDNQTNDIVVRGQNNSFYDCTIQSGTDSPNVDIQQAHGTNFYGGYLRWANVGTASTNTNFFGCGIDQNTGGGIGIQGLKTLYTMRGCGKVDGAGMTVGQYPDLTGNGGKTLKNMTSVRAIGGAVTNDTGEILDIYVSVILTAGSVAQMTVDGVARSYVSNDGASTKNQTLVFRIPNGSTYKADNIAGSVVLDSWYEFRV